MSELSQYDYELPPGLIAQSPLARRADARLMVVDRRTNSLSHRHVRDLPDLLAPGDCLVLNETRVAAARLVGRRTATDGRWEGLFLSADSDGHWRLLCKTRGKLAAGESVTLIDRFGVDDAELELLEKLAGGVWRARAKSSESAFELLERAGRVPLPHYIRGGEMRDSDRERYQTVYARHWGSVAAPTAGLHFTSELLERLVAAGIAQAKLTLHVGIGTFRPIAVEMLAEHPMHREWGGIDASTVEQLRQCRAAAGRIVAVGTTSTRVLETAAQAGELLAWSGETDLFIRPPYRFRAVDGLLTNFHLPRSSLLVLVRTFGGDELIRKAYAEAIRESYRFYSYGDAMLIL
ncbi:MAG TPA: tRNA preQ1(34) S-adenosylmethionine ribosyltransferase-isomerase QueA [Pirellulales bacterium]|nr:tRNA preQ1(34) S-adenosylmethionine ribosyltransferase-isomerase QueA [Pirellulales bacterium]